MTEHKKALIIVTSHDQLGNTGKKTGFHYEELAVPYWKFIDAGYTVDIASIQGGKAPIDPPATTETVKPAAVKRFLDDAEAQRKITNTLPISSVCVKGYCIVYLPGGHGTMWDFPDSKELTALIEAGYAQGSVLSAVCHGLAGFINAKKPDGTHFVSGRKINSFTNAEEEVVGLTTTVPFLLETKLRSLGALFESAPNFAPKVVVDDKLITGQNPASCSALANAILTAACGASVTPNLTDKPGEGSCPTHKASAGCADTKPCDKDTAACATTKEVEGKCCTDNKPKTECCTDNKPKTECCGGDKTNTECCGGDKPKTPCSVDKKN